MIFHFNMESHEALFLLHSRRRENSQDISSVNPASIQKKVIIKYR